MRNSFYQTRKFKYGTAATAFTIAFIAIVVIFNIIFSALSSKYMWYVDMTTDKVFSLSDEAKDILSDITDDVYIYFASEPDVLMNGTNSSFMRYVYTTALQLDENFPNIHVECVDVFKNPSFFRDFYTTAATDIDSDSVVLVSGKEVRVYALEAFFMYDEETQEYWAYNGEKKLLSGIMQVTQTETPIVSFTMQHGEDLESAANLMNVFAENGFAVEGVDLSTTELSDDCRILVIYNPKYDFIGSEAEGDSYNEIQKIDDFLDEYGCLLVYCDPEYVDNLTNLNEFLEEWGISYVSNAYIRDKEHALSVDGYTVITEYQSGSALASIYDDLSALTTPPKTIIRKAMPIEILWESGGGLSGSRNVVSILKSYDTSELVVNGMVQETGAYNVMTLSCETRVIDSEHYYSYVIAAGSPTFANGSYLNSNAYANEDVLSASMKAAGRETVLAVLNFKPLDDDSITVTTAVANNWTVAMTLVIPAIVALIGIVVIIRRKHA
ncbi:MAG: Gldg family protein [Clostridia bacterium]|nr:Gldg family protein [Clostridia bacterium]